MATFQDQYKEIGFIADEIKRLRSLNTSIIINSHQGFLFAEAAITCMATERFLRIIPSMNATDKDTFSNLIDRALSKKRLNLGIPNNTVSVARYKKVSLQIRNGMLHGNFEQLANHYRCSKDIYFGQGSFTQDIQVIFDLLNHFMSRIDP